MLIVVFGAGASYDSVASFPVPTSANQIDTMAERPPLAKNLFDARVADNLFADPYPHDMSDPPLPELLSIFDDLRRPPNGMTVEAVLQQFQEQAPKYPRRHRQLATVRYYLNKTIWRITERWRKVVVRNGSNYHRLLDHIEHHLPEGKIALVTFNYDVLLEDALRHMGIPLNQPRDYTTHDRYKVFKLHGAMNWGHPIVTPILREGRDPQQIIADIIAQAANLQVDSEFVQLAEPLLSSRDGTNFFPALAIPLQVKDIYECPPQQIAMLEGMLQNVTHMLVIGWSATETHFLKMLAGGLRKGVHGMIACGDIDEAAAVRKRLQKEGIDVGDFHTPAQPLQQFSNLLRSETIGDFLARTPALS